MRRSKLPKGDVSWTIPGRKTPIAYSNSATSYLIVALSEGDKTIKEVFNAINFDVAAKAVLKSYIDAGFGDQIANKWFK